jgi:hypothetical protein
VPAATVRRPADAATGYRAAGSASRRADRPDADIDRHVAAYLYVHVADPEPAVRCRAGCVGWFRQRPDDREAAVDAGQPPFGRVVFPAGTASSAKTAPADRARIAATGRQRVGTFRIIGNS